MSIQENSAIKFFKPIWPSLAFLVYYYTQFEIIPIIFCVVTVAAVLICVTGIITLIGVAVASAKPENHEIIKKAFRNTRGDMSFTGFCVKTTNTLAIMTTLYYANYSVWAQYYGVAWVILHFIEFCIFHFFKQGTQDE